MTLLASLLGGIFGIGGGMLTSPLLLIGIAPEVEPVIRDFITHCFTYDLFKIVKMRRKQGKLL